LEYWDALLEGVVQLGGSHGPTSWERFHRSIPGLHDYLPFVEVEVAGVFDREFHDIGYNLRRYTQLSYEDIPSVIRDVFLPAHVRDFGLRQRMMVLVGWWILFSPDEYAALLHYPPEKIVWFLLCHFH